MADIGTLEIRVDSGPVKSASAALEGLQKSGQRAESATQSLQRSFSGLRASTLAIGGLLATAFSGVSLIALTRASVNAVAALNDMATATGASVGKLSALDDVARLSGTSLDTVGNTLYRLNDALTKAKPNSSISAVLRELDLDVRSLKRLDPAEALRQTAVAFSKFADDGNKARAMQVLFGESVRQAAPFLKDLADQGELNASVTKQQAEEAERFNKQLSQMQVHLGNLVRDMSMEAIPTLNEFFSKLQALRTHGGFWGSIGDEVKANMASDRLRVVVGEIESLQRQMDQHGSDSYLEKKMAGLRAEAARLSREALAATDALKAFSDKVQPVTLPEVKVKGTLSGSFGPDKPAKRNTANPNIGPPTFADAYGKEIARLFDDSMVARAEKFTEQLQQLDEVFFSGAKSGQEYDAAVAKLAGSTSTGAKAASDFMWAQQRLQELIDGSASAALERQRKDMQLLADAYKDGRFGIVGTTEAIERYADVVNSTLGNVPRTIKESGKELDEFTKQAGRNMQNTVGDTLSKTLKGDFDNISRLWGNLLLDLAAQAMAANINQYLVGDWNKETKSWSGVLGPVFSGISSLFGGGRAAGGPVSAGKLYEVNERGTPELLNIGNRQFLMMGAQSGHVTPNAGAAAPVLHFHYSIAPGATRAEVLQAMQMTREQTKADVLESMRRAGAFAR